MWWRESLLRAPQLARLIAVFAAASFTAGCWEPLYATRPAANSESVQQKFAAIDIPPIVAPKGEGDPVQRIAVGMFNALQFDLHNGGHTMAPAYRLDVEVGATQFTAVVDPVSGRPDAQIATVTASYQLVEVATRKTVVEDTAIMQVDYDVPGPQQRFASQRALRDAEDRAIRVVAEAIRNRLASYFVAGT